MRAISTSKCIIDMLYIDQKQLLLHSYSLLTTDIMAKALYPVIRSSTRPDVPY